MWQLNLHVISKGAWAIAGGSFFFACGDFWGRLAVHSLPALSFLSGDQLAHTNSAFLGQDQSTMAQQAEMTMADCFPTHLCVSLFFPNRFPHCAWTA